jgi:transcriptional regulator with XRE-family HTH domain
MIFGKKLRELREQKGLLLRQIAAELEVDTATISKIETGTKKATKDQVIQLARILNFDQDKLIALWLGYKVYEIIEDESQASEALKVAEQIIKLKKK